MKDKIPGLQGMMALMAAVGVTCVVMAVQTGLVATSPAWIACGGGLVVAWWAVQAINKK